MTQTKSTKAGERTHKFSVGDKVTMTNQQGVVFPGKTIMGLEHNTVRGPCYYLSPTDTPWFAVEESRLKAEKEAPSAPTQKSATGQKESTPTPWEIVENPSGEYALTIESRQHGSFDTICDCGFGFNAHANAELIVRAVNSHQELLEALKSLTRIADEVTWSENIGVMQPAIRNAEAAIAKAEGRQ